MAVEYIKPNGELLKWIADNMRACDKDEVMASHGMQPLHALQQSVEFSDMCSIVVIDGDICGVVGMTQFKKTGVPWFLGTDNVKKHASQFALQSRNVIDEMVMKTDYLVNFVHSENKDSIKWLKWLGFTIDDPEKRGIKGDLFHKFHMGEETCVIH